MSFAFYSFFIIIALLLAVFAWSLQSPRRQASSAAPPSAIPQDLQSSHISHLPQIRRALAPADFEFASKNIPRDALRRMRRERRRVALAYLSALRADLDKLLSNLVSGYSVRLEEAIRELGERAALVAEMVSTPDRRRIHPV